MTKFLRLNKDINMSKFPLSLGHGGGQVVSVLAYYMMIQIRIPQTSTVLSVKFVFKKNQNEQKEAGISPFFKNSSLIFRCVLTNFNYTRQSRFYSLPYLQKVLVMFHLNLLKLFFFHFAFSFVKYLNSKDGKNLNS